MDWSWTSKRISCVESLKSLPSRESRNVSLQSLEPRDAQPSSLFVTVVFDRRLMSCDVTFPVALGG